MIFRVHTKALCSILIWGLSVLSAPGALTAQQTAPVNATPPADGKTEKPAAKNQPASLTAEQIAEFVVLLHGSRENLQKIRRTGLERGRISRTAPDGRPEEVTYDLRTLRGENAEKDKLRLDQQMPTIEFSLIYDAGKVFGLLKGSVFTPRQDASDELLAASRYGIEALLRYKENGSTVALLGKDKQQNVDCHILELTDKDQRKTRYHISVKYFRVLWADYETVSANGVKAVYKRRYYDYRYAQGTLFPFRSVLYRDGQQISETQTLTVTYGGKLDEAIFQNPEQAAAR